ncbi:hypothetical protein ACLB2K_076972 [Fragaria x ananassa]
MSHSYDMNLNAPLAMGTTIIGVTYNGGVVLGTDSNFHRLLSYGDKNMLQTGLIVGGWDKYEGGKIYGVPLGGTVIESPFSIGGSGSSYLYGFFDQAWREGMSQEEVEALVVKAVSLAIARDGASGEHGLLGALSIPLPLSLNPKATEALALWYGIEYGKKLGLLNVDIRGDALNVLNGLNTRGWDFNEIGGVLDAVRLTTTEFEIVSWRHVKKRFNAVAHELARRALSLAEGWFCKEQGPE